MSGGDRARVGRLVLVRHGQSTYNAENRFTGWRDPELTAEGREQAASVGRSLKASSLRIRCAFTSNLRRTRDSAALILRELGSDLAPLALSSLDERDYGQLTDLDKAQAVRRRGAAQVTAWRRGYAVGPPDGESLRDVTARVARAHLHHLLPAALDGADGLVVAHGNSLRALVGLLENLDSEALERLEIEPGACLVFDVSSDGRAHRSEALGSVRSDLLDAVEAELRVEHGWIPGRLVKE